MQIDPRVLKNLEKIPRKDTERVLFTIQNLPSNPFNGDIQKMRDEKNVWRRRIGAYRIFYELIPQSKIVFVFWLERRTSKTYKKR